MTEKLGVIFILLGGLMIVTIMGLDIEESILGDVKKEIDMYGCEIKNYSSIEKLKKEVKRLGSPRIIVIDIEHNKEQKFKLAAEIKKESNSLIIFLSSSNDSDDRVRWMSFGITAYIQKPFRAEELLRQARTLSEITQTTVLKDNNFDIDLKNRTIEYRGEVLKTTPKLFDLIVYFVENEGVVLTRECLMVEVFDTDSYLTDRNIDALIKRLRCKTSYELVNTVRGVGYIYKNIKSNS